jgi:hypothetical protein
MARDQMRAAVWHLDAYGSAGTKVQQRWCDAQGVFIVYVQQRHPNAEEHGELYGELLDAADLRDGTITVVQKWGVPPGEEIPDEEEEPQQGGAHNRYTGMRGWG